MIGKIQYLRDYNPGNPKNNEPVLIKLSLNSHCTLIKSISPERPLFDFCLLILIIYGHDIKNSYAVPEFKER